MIGKLTHSDLRGYRALWLYLAGSAAWLAHQAAQLPDDNTAKDYFRQAQAAAPVLRWLVALRTNATAASSAAATEDPRLTAMIERLETVLERMGTIHDRKFDAEEAAILNAILQDDDGTLFEDGHKRLGTLLGFSSENSSDDAAPDPLWIADDSFCVVCEDHAGAKANTVLSATKARQAASHPDWIKSNLPELANAQIVLAIITPCSKAYKGAIPSLKRVRYWARKDFRTWAKTALQVLREIRRDFPGPGNLGWRATAATRFKEAKIAPAEIDRMLSKSAADTMTVVAGGEEA